MNTDHLYARTTRNRVELADFLDSLDPEQWHAPTLCQGWTVRHVAAHLIQPMLVGFGRFFLVAVRHRGNTPGHRRPLHPGYGRDQNPPSSSLSCDATHQRKGEPAPGRPYRPIRRNLHPPARHRPAAEPHRQRQAGGLGRPDHLHQTSPNPAPSLTTPQRTTGLMLVATDADWRHGTGPRVAGSLEALTMAITGRQAALDDLDGPGAAATLRGRL